MSASFSDGIDSAIAKMVEACDPTMESDPTQKVLTIFRRDIYLASLEAHRNAEIHGADQHELFTAMAGESCDMVAMCLFGSMLAYGLDAPSARKAAARKDLTVSLAKRIQTTMQEAVGEMG